MASYSVTLLPPAIDELNAIAFPFRRQLNQLIYKLKTNPRPTGAVLYDADQYSVPAHGWLILYRIDDDALHITIVGFLKVEP